MKNDEYRVNLVSKYITQLNLSEDIKKYFLGKNILVTGGAGAIGSNLVIALSELVGQKGIIIGHQGLGLKRIGSEARRDIEKMLDKKVFLVTPVKVKKNWRNDKLSLKRFGYNL